MTDQELRDDLDRIDGAVEDLTRLLDEADVQAKAALEHANLLRARLVSLAEERQAVVRLQHTRAQVAAEPIRAMTL